MAQQYTTVYAKNPAAAARRFSMSPIIEFGSVQMETEQSFLFAGMRTNGDDIALRFERTPAQYVRDMRAIHGGK